ncbi:ABC transporter permease [Pseudarthrobacter siccitolerans]|nr:ABC transporter permease [Pseudarthrobacter siccitolerans]
MTRTGLRDGREARLPQPALLAGRLARKARPRRSIGAVTAIAFGWVGLLCLLAFVVQWLPVAEPQVSVAEPRLAPFVDWAHPLGADAQGRDELSRLLYGARASIGISFVAMMIGLAAGTAVGVLAGYTRGKFDAFVGVITDAGLAFPGLVLIVGIAAVLGPGMQTLIIGLGAVSFPVFVRVARANTLRFSAREFVHAAHLTGARTGRIITRELLPNVIPPVFAYAIILMATLITAEASLSFLGLGLQPPTPSWGNMIAEGQYELASFPHLVFVPAAILALTVFSLNVIGDVIVRKFNAGDSKI